MTSPHDPWQQGGPPSSGTPSGQAPQSQPQDRTADPWPSRDPRAGQDSRAARSPRAPRTVRIAFWIAMVAPLVSTVLIAAQFLALRSAFGAGAGEFDQGQSLLGSVFVTLFLLFTFFFVLLTGLWILFGFQLRAGRNWARTVLTVFAAVWFVSAVSTLASGSVPGLFGMGLPSVLGVLGWVHAGLGAVAMAAFVLLAFAGPSNWFFQAAERSR